MNKRFEVLDSFRGLAALFVVLHHMHFVGSISEHSFFKHSFLFVEFFFILSGFVLAHAYAYKKNLQFKDYFIARTFRIFPLHLVVLIPFILLELLKLLVHQTIMPLHTIPFENAMSPSEILPNILLLQAWLPFAHTISFNPPAWSISIEYYMYMIFFVTLLLKSPLKILSWFFISMTMFYFIIIGFNVDPVILRGLSAFFLGILVYVSYKKLSTKIKISSLYFTLLEGILLFLVPYLLTLHIVSYKPLIMTGLFSFIVFVFAFEKGLLSSFLKHKIFLYFAKLSYSIYMTHVFILFSFLWLIILIEKIFKIELTPMIGNIVYIDLGTALYNNLLIVFLLAVIVFVSHFTYKYVEQKGQAFGKSLKERLKNQKAD